MAIISVIIPTLDEEAVIGATLEALSPVEAETIVVDGGSTDRTVEITSGHSVRVITSGHGRAAQMNIGAREAGGDVLLFLHADCLPPIEFKQAIEEALDMPDVVAGAFDLSITASGFSYRLIERMANLRSRMTSVPYGDQGLFIRKETFMRMGGFSEIPIMEDVDMGRRLKRMGRVVFIDTPIKANARRWQRQGAIYTTLKNWALVSAYLLGASPERLASHYRQAR